MQITLIAAIGRNREIGKDNDLLWHLPDDMRFFRETTIPHHVIMGRLNYESIPPRFRPLYDRTNIVLTRNPEYQAPECFICHSLEEALQLARDHFESEAFIIGGADVYAQSLPLAGRMYLTHVDGDFPEADAFFPEFDPAEWTVTTLAEHPEDLSHSFAFRVARYDRIQPPDMRHDSGQPNG